MSKLSSSKFCHYRTQSSADALIVALLWKLPQMPSCSANNINLDKTNFDMFYNIDCFAAIHGRIWKNYVPNYIRIIMLACTTISFVIFFLKFLRQLESNPGFLLRNSIKLLTQNMEKVILTCSTKIIAEQSSVIQYAWPMCHIKEE